MLAFDRFFPLHATAPFVQTLTGGVLFAVLLLSGCGGEDPNKKSLVSQADTTARSDSLAHRLAARYLRLSYKGASLRSTHPLNDSLLALRGGRPAGGPVLLVDTFYVQPELAARTDSSRTVRVRVPTALTVSRTWRTSNPQTGTTVTVRVQDTTVTRAPRLVGWPALRTHLRRVEPDSGTAIAERLHKRWTALTKERPGV
ncbi:MAG: hypothetical protein ABEL51_12405 [Salinibacter sp.]